MISFMKREIKAVANYVTENTRPRPSRCLLLPAEGITPPRPMTSITCVSSMAGLKLIIALRAELFPILHLIARAGRAVLSRLKESTKASSFRSTLVVQAPLKPHPPLLREALIHPSSIAFYGLPFLHALSPSWPSGLIAVAAFRQS